jgi:chromosome transmission fidelity protein 1
VIEKPVHWLQEEVLNSVMDIEKLVKAGESSGACPYYASRNAALEADLLLLPHSALLVQASSSLFVAAPASIFCLASSVNLHCLFRQVPSCS